MFFTLSQSAIIRIWRTVCPALAASLELLAHCRNVASLCINLVDVHLNWLNWFHLLILVAGPLVILTGCMVILSPFLEVKGTSCQQFLSSYV